MGLFDAILDPVGILGGGDSGAAPAATAAAAAPPKDPLTPGQQTINTAIADVLGIALDAPEGSTGGTASATGAGEDADEDALLAAVIEGLSTVKLNEDTLLIDAIKGMSGSKSGSAGVFGSGANSSNPTGALSLI